MKEEILSHKDLVGIGNRLKALRSELGMNQRELAAQLGFSASYISEVEKGKSNPGFNFLLHLYRKYKVSLDWLILDEGEMFCGTGLGENIRYYNFDFGDQKGNVYAMLELMNKSQFFLNTMMAQYIKHSISNDDIIQKELDRNKPDSKATRS